MSDLNYLSEIALKFGPFLFVLLFLLIIDQRANSAYKNEPKDSPRLGTFRGWFIASKIIIILLISVCTVWWLYNPPSRMNIFSGTIINLRDYEKIESPELYFRNYTPDFVDHAKIAHNAKIREEAFLISSNEPFFQEKNFSVYYRKQGSANPQKLVLRYTDKPNPAYRVVYDKTNDQHYLKLDEQKHSGKKYELLNFFGNAYAQDKKMITKTQDIARKTRKIPKQAIDLGPNLINLRVIETLQNERAPVGLKIDLLKVIDRSSKNILDQYVKYTSKKEPMALTLLDLSRHTDRQLANKAKEILKKFNLPLFVNNALKSDSSNANSVATKILRRISIDDFIFILAQNKFDEDSSMLIEKTIRKTMKKAQEKKLQARASPKALPRYPKKLQPKIKNLKSFGSKVLIPTGSSQGDRYYVKAIWSNNPGSKKIVKCLTELFFRSLIHNRIFGR